MATSNSILFSIPFKENTFHVTVLLDEPAIIEEGENIASFNYTIRCTSSKELNNQVSYTKAANIFNTYFNNEYGIVMKPSKNKIYIKRYIYEGMPKGCIDFYEDINDFVTNWLTKCLATDTFVTVIKDTSKKKEEKKEEPSVGIFNGVLPLSNFVELFNAFQENGLLDKFKLKNIIYEEKYDAYMFAVEAKYPFRLAEDIKYFTAGYKG